MAIDERSRHQLHVRLEEVLGPEPATTLMEHLPPVGWSDVATKRDLDVLGKELRGEMALLKAEISGALTSQTRAMFFAIVTIVLTMSGLVFAVAR